MCVCVTRLIHIHSSFRRDVLFSNQIELILKISSLINPFRCLDIMRRISLRNILCTISLSVLCLCVIFLINNATNSNDLDESLNIGCDCSSKQGELRRRIPPVVNTNVLKPCEQVEKTSPVQRAIIIYYPNHQSDYFFPEVRW